MTSMFHTLESIIVDRKNNPQPGSYTNHLFDTGRNKIAQKVGEEATEVIVAALGQTRSEQTSEIADLIYHLLVLMADLDIPMAEIEAELHKRHNSNGTFVEAD